MAIARDYISNRSGVQTILVGTLLKILRQRTPMADGIPVRLADIINNAASMSHIQLSTTRVPAFGADRQDPSHVYRAIGILSSIPIGLQPPPLPPAGLLLHELMPLCANNHITEMFLQNYSPYGLQANSHFIIIFSDQPNSHFQDNSSFHHPGVDQHLLSVDFHSSAIGDGTPSPTRDCTPSPIGHGTPSSLSDLTRETDFASMFGDTIHTSSDIVSFIPSSAVTTVNSPSQWLRQNMSPPSSLLDDSIEALCRSRGISADVIEKAKYLTEMKSLVKMAWNHRAMVKILMALDLHGRITDTFLPNKMVTVSDEMVLQAEMVVKKFGWSSESFKHKCVWYGWAEMAAKSKKWKGSTPGMYHCLVYLQHHF